MRAGLIIVAITAAAVGGCGGTASDDWVASPYWFEMAGATCFTIKHQSDKALAVCRDEQGSMKCRNVSNPLTLVVGTDCDEAIAAVARLGADPGGTQTGETS
jgi:hypothetical protein